MGELDVKKAEHWRTDAFEQWCWRRLLRLSWTARRTNQSILKEISPEYTLEELTLKLKLQYFSHLMRRAELLAKTWCWERLKAEAEGRTEDEMAGWHHRLDGHELEQASGAGKGQRSLVCCSRWGSQSETQLSGWTTTVVLFTEWMNGWRDGWMTGSSRLPRWVFWRSWSRVFKAALSWHQSLSSLFLNTMFSWFFCSPNKWYLLKIKFISCINQCSRLWSCFLKATFLAFPFFCSSFIEA